MEYIEYRYIYGHLGDLWLCLPLGVAPLERPGGLPSVRSFEPAVSGKAELAAARETRPRSILPRLFSSALTLQRLKGSLCAIRGFLGNLNPKPLALKF